MPDPIVDLDLPFYLDPSTKSKMCPLLSPHGVGRVPNSDYSYGKRNGSFEYEQSFVRTYTISYSGGGIGFLWQLANETIWILPARCVYVWCQLWVRTGTTDEGGGYCGLIGGGQATAIIPEAKVYTPYAAELAQEYFYKEKIADDGKGIYGHDWIYPKGQRPPALENIPPVEVDIQDNVKIETFTIQTPVVDSEAFKTTQVVVPVVLPGMSTNVLETIGTQTDTSC